MISAMVVRSVRSEVSASGQESHHIGRVRPTTTCGPGGRPSPQLSPEVMEGETWQPEVGSVGVGVLLFDLESGCEGYREYV